MNAGDFWYNKTGQRMPSHPWIIISDPEQDPDNVLIVNLTDYENIDDHSCVLLPEAEQHEGITKKSCVNYQDAKVTSSERLSVADSAGLLYWKQPASDALLAKLRHGAQVSDELYGKHRELLRSQGLID